MTVAGVGEWRPIETAPKDGTPVFIWCRGWDSAPIASWGEYPANPVMGSNEESVWMEGWLIEDCHFYGGHEEGFLGWNDDPMPTHWSPVPEASP
jgi:hypothetical protein